MAPWKLATMAWLTLGGAAAFGIDETVLDCEQAVLKLSHCCNDERFREYRCDVQGCSAPSLTEDDIECIERSSCSEIAAAGICDWSGRPEEHDVDPGEPLCG
jgi:hypothetical protein